MTELDPRLEDVVRRHAFPLVFATVSGAHLYGFPSADSDWDLRGVHVLGRNDVLGLRTGPETIELLGDTEGLDLDLVTHDARKFFLLMLKRNGYVLEQVHSPLVVHTTPEHEELRAIARDCVTRHHARHYLGFAAGQTKLIGEHDPPRAKPVLYAYRVLLTGIHLMRTGEVEANLRRLNDERHLPGVTELIARKREGAEKETLPAADLPHHLEALERLADELTSAAEISNLPDAPTAEPALNDLLLRLRTA